MAREITVTIDPNGNAKIETRGFAGKECLAATADLEKALGVKTSDVKTREFNQTQTQTAAAKTSAR